LELGGDNKPVEVSLLVSSVLGIGDLGRESRGNRGCRGCIGYDKSDISSDSWACGCVYGYVRKLL